MAWSTAGGHFLLLALFLLSSPAYGQLSTNFYTDCSSLDTIVSGRVNSTLATDPRMGASLLRLFFHDCFVQVRIINAGGEIVLEDSKFTEIMQY
jgi:peroxidase